MDNSIKIIEAFSLGRFPGSDGQKPKRITTAISNVFVCEDKAYKIYKGDSDFFNKSFNDLSIKSNRFTFTREDFKWNNNLSPEIYIELKGLVWNNGISFAEADEDSDDLVIIMNKIDMSNVLISKLIDNKITIDDCYNIGFQLAKREKTLLNNHKDGMNLYEDFKARYKDMEAWVAGASKYFPEDEMKGYLNKLSDFIETNKDKFNNGESYIGPCLDIHADNAIVDGESFLPIDTYAPKKDWLFGYKYINIYRVATDIYAFLGKEYFDRTLQGYMDANGEKLPREFDKELVLYCELITCPYQYMLSEKDPSRLGVAQRYHHFLKNIYN